MGRTVGITTLVVSMTCALLVGVVSAGVAQPAPCADLEITSFSVAPPSPVEGQPTVISTTVRNNGTCATPEFIVQWRQDRFAPVGPSEQVPGLGAGQSRIVQFDFIFTAPGNFLTVVEVDTENSVLETNEVNNLEIFPVSVSPAIADLIVTNLVTSPVPPIEGEPSQVIMTVRNSGNVAAKSFLTQVTPGFLAAPLTREVANLGPGAVGNVVFDHVFPFAGDVNIDSVVDPTNVVPEANEFNNSRSTTQTVVPRVVDLAVDAIAVTPDPAVQGWLTKLDVTVRNDGNVATGPVKVKLQPTLDVLSQEIASLGAGAQQTVSFDYTYPLPGIWTAIASIDAPPFVFDADITNNLLTRPVQVDPPLPDLVVESFTIDPGSPVAGLQAKAKITVRNIGHVAAPAFIVAWTTQEFGHVRNVEVDGLDPGEAKTVEIAHTYPLPGDFVTSVVVDSTLRVLELDEFNNGASTAVSVQVPTVDLVLVSFNIVPVVPQADKLATANILIRNDGNFPSAGFLVTWKTTPFGPDRNVEVAGLDPGAQELVKLTHTYQVPGQLITTTATVDSANQIVETNETNNTKQRQVTIGPVGPDLIVTDISIRQNDDIPRDLLPRASASVVQGLPDTYAITVRNIGNRPAGPFELEWNPGVPFELITQGPRTLSTQITGLAAGASTTVEFDYAYPLDGNFRSVANADAFNDVQETNEANNLRILNVTALPGIDLQITNLQVVPAVGGQVVAQSEAIGRVTVRNNGFAPARNFLVSWNPNGTSANLFNPSETVVELLPGASRTVEFSTSYFFPGSYDHAAVVDTLDQVSEWNENNNTASSAVSVVPRTGTVRLNFLDVRILRDLDDGLDFDAEVIVVAAALQQGGNCTGFTDFIDEIAGIFDDIGDFFGFIDDINVDLDDVRCTKKEYSVNLDPPPKTVGLSQSFTIDLEWPAPLLVFGVLGEEDEPLIGEFLGAFADIVLFDDVFAGPTRVLQPVEAEGSPTNEFADLRYRIEVLSAPPPVFRALEAPPLPARSPAVLGKTVSRDSVGLVDPTQGQWHLRNEANAINSFYFGNPGDVPMMGDWDCNGSDTPGLYRQSDGFVYLSNANRSQIADIRFFFGDPDDVPLAGDFNGDGCDTVSVYRPSEGRVYVINELGSEDRGLGAASFSYMFGNPGDRPIVGDFDGDGVDSVGMHRASDGRVYLSNKQVSSAADAEFTYGDPDDRLVAGDWTGDGADTPGLFRPSELAVYLRHVNAAGQADDKVRWGKPDWIPVAGMFG